MPEDLVKLFMPLGNALCLDFANTTEPRGQADAFDFLATYEDLVHWAAHVGMISRGSGTKLRREGSGAPRRATAVFDEARFLREAISSVFEAIAMGRTPPRKDLDEITRSYRSHLKDTSLVTQGERFGFATSPSSDLGSPLWPVVGSAVELLTHGDLKSIKICAGDCRWLFLDTSKNHSRRWCTMAVCGSRDKMRRHYARHRVGT